MSKYVSKSNKFFKGVVIKLDVRTIHKLSPTKCKIIERLFVYRSLTPYQVFFLLNPDNIPLTYPHFSWELLNLPKMRSIWNQLAQMQKNGIIQVAARLSNDTKVLTLSEEGLSVAYSLLDIPEIEGYHNTGWNNEYGYFPYELYRPPKERLQKHHNLGIDFNVLMELLAIKHNFTFDFIDNRYASVEFNSTDDSTKMEVTKIFRPDGEFIIRPNGSDKKFHCWVEFDMGTEKGKLLYEKFSKYNQFLSYLSEGVDRNSLATSIPNAIFFVTTARQNIWSRWQNILRNYLNAIGKWSTYLNMYVGNIESLENLVLSFINEEEIFKTKLNLNLRPLLNDHAFVGQPKPSESLVNASSLSSFCYLYGNEMKILGWEPYFTVTRTKTNEHQVFLYVKFDEYETGGISKAIDFALKFSSVESMKRISAIQVIPVLVFSDKKPHSLDFIGCNQKDEFDCIFDKYLWHDVSENNWFDKKGRHIESNPLNLFLDE
ncbi:hypothetical protein [Paenibacillus illinoisensis]|uniref:hypothetical protein n=1 Tax=Paenibacillus illinoisensis TaxID=59845 RepID=UPI003D99C286